MGKLANALLGLFTGCFLFVGLQTVSQLNLVQALGVGAESSFVLEAGQRVRPTATPALAINLENLLTLESDNSSGQDRSADVPNGTENSITQNSISGEEAAFNPVIADAVEREAALGPTVAGPTVADTDQSDLAALAPASRSALNSVNGEQPPEVNNAQPALAEAPAAPEIAQTNEVVSIQEPYGVNARSGPDTSYNVITVLERGLTLAVLGRSDDGQWIQVQLPGQAVGWVASWVVVVGTR